ncbi:DNA-3-methyladenine glycosylase [Paenibacillus konkukensis]|uniref:DNA-3-methyladenine glycosylase II n=1 Tax=Paenibacillus konkukensis TaxID=2020716 RepID=A0ABY4RHM3_9BACL|nr:DNA-3-methyladenine glycosylase 2 family protein [Paenibacillus konkukensis]UQZ81356.1 DNA-3-methyladenine glycosylase [Paenibacillus konkukensis]
MAPVATKYFSYSSEDVQYLAGVDEKLGAAMFRMGKVQRVVIPELFPALVHAIVAQLISAKSAQTVWERMQDQWDEITPQALAMLTADDIQRCGITMKKAVCIHTIAETVASGALNLDELYHLPDNEVIRKLTALHGIGMWTAEMMLIHCMERRDIVSWGDIAIRRGMKKLYGLDELTKAQFDRYRAVYSPLGSVASIYLWELSFE